MTVTAAIRVERNGGTAWLTRNRRDSLNASVDAGSLDAVVVSSTTPRLGPGVDGIVEPDVPHEVEPADEVRFVVEFRREPEPGEAR